MPPLYDYQCQKCKAKTAVLRTFQDYDKGPGTDETDPAPSVPEGAEECEEHQWERIIGGNPTVVKSWRWGAKGHW
jgi:hypothetical protein